MEKFLTLTEVAEILGMKESEVVKLAEEGQITGYRIGGNFLRFKLTDIDAYRKKISGSQNNALALATKPKAESNYSLKDRIYDFFYYHDFYIVMGLLISLLLIIIFKF